MGCPAGLSSRRGGSIDALPGLPWRLQVDMVGKQYKLIRPPRWGSRLAKRRLKRQLAEVKAPW